MFRGQVPHTERRGMRRQRRLREHLYQQRVSAEVQHRRGLRRQLRLLGQRARVRHDQAQVQARRAVEVPGERTVSVQSLLVLESRLLRARMQNVRLYLSMPLLADRRTELRQRLANPRSEVT